jgi:hypothetical protein
LNPNDRIGTSTYPSTSAVLSNGNLDWSTIGQTGYGFVRGSIGMSSGKWYWEVTATNTGDTLVIGLARFDALSPVPTYPYLGQDSKSWGYLSSSGQKYTNDSASSYGASYGVNDVIGVAYDADNGTLTFYKNGTSQGQAFTGLNSGPYFPVISDFSGSGTTGCSAVFNFGARPFQTAAPSGFKALCTQNLPAPLVTKPNTVMDVALYTGNGSTQSISSLAFGPDLVWIKARNLTYYHRIVDSVRGVQKFLYSNSTDVEETSTLNGRFNSFDATGFTLGSADNTGGDGINQSTAPYVAWCWDAGTSTVSNTQGSISSGSQVRANTSAGFSVVTWTGQATAATIGHGLGAAPSLIICKSRSNVQSWGVYHKDTGIDKYILLDSTGAATTYSGIWGSSAPTSTVFGVPGNVGLNNNSGWTYVAYCFAPVVGYSSAFSYTGNGDSSGPFVYLGFRPRFIIQKRTDSTGSWLMIDTARDPVNVARNELFANSSIAEADNTSLVDVLSNGFKIRATFANMNASGGSFIGYAFAEAPFNYSRAR